MINIHKILVRRHNGQNPYGPWMRADNPDIPSWVGDLAADEIAENDVNEGLVEQGGSAWEWKRSV